MLFHMSLSASQPPLLTPLVKMVMLLMMMVIDGCPTSTEILLPDGPCREEARSMSLERRFRLCCRAVLLYSQWFDLPRSALPEEFWALLVPEAGGARE